MSWYGRSLHFQSLSPRMLAVRGWRERGRRDEREGRSERELVRGKWRRVKEREGRSRIGRSERELVRGKWRRAMEREGRSRIGRNERVGTVTAGRRGKRGRECMWV